jgi:DNA-binding transcriptional LysR family regulator
MAIPPALFQLRFKHLRLIDILARTGNLHRVATELAITQPAVTKILQDVEQILGVSLFDRSARPLVPTDLGRHAVDYARRTLADGERFAGSLSNLSRGGFGALSLGAIMATASDLLPRAIAKLKHDRPMMTIQIMAATSDKLTSALRQGELDVVLGRMPIGSAALHFNFEGLGIEELWAFVGKEHRLARHTDIDPAMLEYETWVLQPAPSPLRHAIDAFFIESGLRTPDNVVETTSVSAMLELVRHAGMVTILPSTIVQREVERADFVRLPLNIENDLPPFGIVTRRDEAITANASEFIGIVRELASRG